LFFADSKLKNDGQGGARGLVAVMPRHVRGNVGLRGSSRVAELAQLGAWDNEQRGTPPQPPSVESSRLSGCG
jgi:hypothetical protein